MRLVYFGTYTSAGSRGIYVSRLDENGHLEGPALAAASEDPSFLAVHPNGTHLYAVNELQLFEGRPSGAVSAFALDSESGRLTFLDRQPSEGASPCHIVVDRAGRHVLVANYHGGSVAVLAIAENGGLRPADGVTQHTGHGPHAERQEAPHAHSIHLDPTGRFALAVDLGIDKVLVYRYGATSGRLTPHDPPHMALTPGNGPRHLCFHPGGRGLYVDNELASTVTAFGWDAATGRLTEQQTLPTLPADFKGGNTTGEIQVTPDGRFLYVSNRGHDSLAVFAIDATTGALTSAGFVSTGGRTPRHFGIDPSGGYLLAANQDSDNVVVFRIDPRTGGLTPTGSSVTVSRPVCVTFLR